MNTNNTVKTIEVNTTDDFSTSLKKAEATIYELALQESRYNQSKAAKSLGVSRGTLRTKVKQYFGTKYIV